MKEFKTMTELDVLRMARTYAEDKWYDAKQAFDKASKRAEIVKNWTEEDQEHLDRLGYKVTKWADRMLELDDAVREML